MTLKHIVPYRRMLLKYKNKIRLNVYNHKIRKSKNAQMIFFITFPNDSLENVRKNIFAHEN